MGLYDEVGVPAAGMHVPTEGEGLSMADEIARWNEVGPALRPRGRRAAAARVGAAGRPSRSRWTTLRA